MTDEFVPDGFEPPTSLTTDRFRLEPLGPQHNESDHAAWTSSIEHIHATPGFAGSWPPPEGNCGSMKSGRWKWQQACNRRSRS